MSKRDDLLAKINSYLVTNGVRAITADKLNEIATFIADNYSTSEELSTNVLSDVDKTGIATNDILRWNGTKFVKYTPVYSIGDLSNVDLTGIATNDILIWNGSKFIHLAFLLSELKDVKISSLKNRQHLEWDSDLSVFRNKELSSVVSISANFNVDENTEDTIVVTSVPMVISLNPISVGRTFEIITPSTTTSTNKVVLNGSGGTKINGLSGYNIITPNTVVKIKEVASGAYIVTSNYRN